MSSWWRKKKCYRVSNEVKTLLPTFGLIGLRQKKITLINQIKCHQVADIYVRRAVSGGTAIFVKKELDFKV